MTPPGISLVPMDNVIHIIGSDTPAEMLNQAAALASDRDTIVSTGPKLPREQFNRKTISVRSPLDSAPLAGLQLRKLTKDAQLLHVWSHQAAAAVQWTASGKPIIFSLPHLRGVHQADIAISGAFDGLWSLTVPTDAQRRVLIALGLHPKCVFVLPPAAKAPGDAKNTRNRIREELGLDEHHFLLAAAGEMVHANGHKQACWAHAMARILTDHTRVIFPGNGQARRAVEIFARSTGHQGEIFFTAGDLDPMAVLTASDAAVFLQPHDCGVGPLADAMACGLPILAANRPEIANLAPHGQAALLSPPGDMRQATDNLLKLAQDAELRQTLGRQAKKLADKQFAPEITKTKLTAIYASVLSGRS
jgi:glycosyltransferase involved in cell wall biosynthesis